MKIFNQSQNTVIAERVIIAQTIFSRIIGLLNRSSISAGEALVITKCHSIHMFFMKFAIDVIFVDKNNIVVGLVENIKPFQFSPIFLKASYVIEAPLETIARTKTRLGDKIEIL